MIARVEAMPGMTDTFTHLCLVCGATVAVTEGATQPHRCRIDLDRAASA